MGHNTDASPVDSSELGKLLDMANVIAVAVALLALGAGCLIVVREIVAPVMGLVSFVGAAICGSIVVRRVLRGGWMRAISLAVVWLFCLAWIPYLRPEAKREHNASDTGRQREGAISALDPAIFFDAVLTEMPSVSPDDGILELDPSPVSIDSGRLVRTKYVKGAQMIKSGTTVVNVKAYRYDVINDGDRPLIDVHFQLPVSFCEFTKQEGRQITPITEHISLKDDILAQGHRYRLIERPETRINKSVDVDIPRLDPGKSMAFSFFITNRSNRLLWIGFPESARGLVLGRGAPQEIKAIHPSMGEIGPFLFPFVGPSPGEPPAKGPAVSSIN